MDKITVPQFLEVESKVIGPITIRQFIELIIAGLIIFIFYKLFDFSLFAVSGLAVLGITLVVAFVKINGQSFHYFILNFLATLKSPKLKVWRRSLSRKEVFQKREKEQDQERNRSQNRTAPRVTSSRLSELSLIVDTGGVYQGENNNFKQ